MRNAIQSRTAFVVCLNDIPWSHTRVRCCEHRVSRPRVIVPAAMRFQIHRAKLPNLARIVDAFGEPARLLLPAYFEPIFNERESSIDNVSLPGRRLFKESIIFLVRAKSHHSLHASTIIPASVENHYFARGWKMLEIALKIDL